MLKNSNAGGKYLKANLRGNKHKEIKQALQEILFEPLAIFPQTSDF